MRPVLRRSTSRKAALAAGVVLLFALGAVSALVLSGEKSPSSALALDTGAWFLKCQEGSPARHCDEIAPPTTTEVVTSTEPGPTTTEVVTTTVPEPPPPSSIYWGARIDGQFYVTNYNGTSSSDAPFGGSTDPLGAWTLFEQHAGKEVSFVHWGGSGNAWPPTDFNAQAAQRAWDNGAFSMYGLSLPKTGLDALLANSATAKTNLGTLALQMAAWGKPILFRPLWEMNGNWFAWGRQAYTPAQYVTMWRNLWTIFQDAGARNVSFAWVPNTCSGTTVCASTDTVPDPSPWYPGDGYVDWTGMEGYVKSGYLTPEKRFTPTYNVLLQFGKPMVIGEMGIAADAALPGKAQFISDFLGTWLPEHPQVKAFSYFNEATDPPQPHIEVGDGANVFNGTALEAWRVGIADPYYEANAALGFPVSGKVPVP